MAIILQYIKVSNQEAVHLKFAQCYIWNIFQLKNKNNRYLGETNNTMSFYYNKSCII